MINRLKKFRNLDLEYKTKEDKIKKSTNYLDYDSSRSTAGKKTNTKLNPRVFRRAPGKSALTSKLTRLASFAVLGLDIKITPDQEVKFIEVNGISSGMRGFGEAGVECIEGQTYSIDELKEIYSSKSDDEELWKFIGEAIKEIRKNSCENALRDHLRNLGEAPAAYIGARLLAAGKKPIRLEGAESVFGTEYLGSVIENISNSLPGLPVFSLYHINPEWDLEFGEVAETLVGIEDTLENKLRTDRLFSGMRDLKPESYKYTEEEFQRLLSEYNPKYVVIKPIDGRMGRNLEIVEADSKIQERPPCNSNMVAEAFIPSKLIPSSQDRKEHDGCMRYIVVAEETKEGKISFNHFGGYWRLAPTPISDGLDLDAMRANLHQNAIAEKVSEEDLELVRKTINTRLPVFYENLVNRANS